MKKLIAIFALSPLLLFGCSSDKEPAAEPENADMPADQPAEAVAAEYDAICGCSLDGVGVCGNYVEIDGEHVVLEHPDLGVMEFCEDKEKGARIKIAGAMADGKFVATHYERVD